MQLEVKRDADAAQRVHVNLLGTAGLGLASGAHDGGGQHARVAAGLGVCGGLGAPGHRRANGFEVVGVAALGGLGAQLGAGLGQAGVDFVVDGVGLSQALTQLVAQILRQVVQPEVADAGDEVAMAVRGGVGGGDVTLQLIQQRHVALRQQEVRARVEAAHGAATDPGFVAGFQRFLNQGGAALRLAGVGPCVAGVVGVGSAVLQGRGRGAAVGSGGGHGGGHCGLDLVVPAQRHAGGGLQAAQAAEGLDGVLLFLAAGAVVADSTAAQCVLTAEVFRAAGFAGAVGEDDHAVPCGAVGVVFAAVGQAFAGQQLVQEGQVGLAVLHGVAAQAGVGAGLQVRIDAVGPVPGGVRVGLKQAFCDLNDSFLLPHAAGAAAGQQSLPGLDREAVTRQRAVSICRLRCGDDAAARVLAAVGQARVQRELGPQHGLHIQRSVGGQHVDLHHPRGVQRLLLAPALHEQPRQRAFALQAVQACGVGEQALQKWCEVGEHQRLGLVWVAAARTGLRAGQAWALPQYPAQISRRHLSASAFGFWPQPATRPAMVACFLDGKRPVAVDLMSAGGTGAAAPPRWLSAWLINAAISSTSGSRGCRLGVRAAGASDLALTAAAAPVAGSARGCVCCFGCFCCALGEDCAATVVLGWVGRAAAATL